MRTAAFAGIAQPGVFFETIVELRAELVYANALPDHYPLSRDLLESLVQEAKGLKPEMWVITEKDWVRLPEALPENMNLWVLTIDIDLGDASTHLKSIVRQSLGMAVCGMRSNK